MPRRGPPNALLRVDNGGDAAAARAQRGARPKRDAPGPEGPVPEVAPTELNPVRPRREKQKQIWKQRDLADSSDEEEDASSPRITERTPSVSSSEEEDMLRKLRRAGRAVRFCVSHLDGLQLSR